MQHHHPLRQKTPSRSPMRALNRGYSQQEIEPYQGEQKLNHHTPIRNAPSSMILHEPLPTSHERSSISGLQRSSQRESYGHRAGESPLRKSSISNRTGLQTTDGRMRSGQTQLQQSGFHPDGSAIRADTDLYYSTDKSSALMGTEDLMEQAMTIVRRKKNMQTNQTSPRRMLLTAAGQSQETDSSRPQPIMSSYDRSSAKDIGGQSTKSRGRRPFEKTSYKDSFPIRCTGTEKLNSKARNDIEHRQMALGDLSSSAQESSQQINHEPKESVDSLNFSITTASQAMPGSLLRVKSRSGISPARPQQSDVAQEQRQSQMVTASREAPGRSPLRVKSAKSESETEQLKEDQTFRQNNSTNATTQLESEIVSRSAQKFSQATNSLKEMQQAIQRAQDQIEKASPPRQRSDTPRNTRSVVIVEDPILEDSEDENQNQQYMVTQTESLKTSLKKELGIDEPLDGSPHRFFDWEQDEKGNGASDPNSFLTIEQQIRQRAERLHQIEVEKKEAEVARKQRRRQKRSERRAELETLKQEHLRMSQEQDKLETLQEEQELHRSLSKKREALEELSILKEEHEKISKEQNRLEKSLRRKQRESASQREEESEEQVVRRGRKKHKQVVISSEDGTDVMNMSYSESELMQKSRGQPAIESDKEDNGPTEVVLRASDVQQTRDASDEGSAGWSEPVYSLQSRDRSASVKRGVPRQQNEIHVQDQAEPSQQSVNRIEVKPEQLPFPFVIQQELAKLADPQNQVQPKRDAESIKRRIKQIHVLEQEKHKLVKKKEEIKRLQNISQSPPPRRVVVRSRSKSAGKRTSRPFVAPDQNHERWTNCFARKSTQWDSEDGLLLQEKEQAGKIKRDEKHPMRCCGNSPGKSHMQYCEVPRPGEQLIPTIYGTPFKRAYYHPEPAKTEPPRQSRSRSQPRKVRRSKNNSRSTNKRRRRRSPLREKSSQFEENLAPQINVVSSSTGAERKPDSYFVGRHDGSKVRKIAQRIQEIASNADPQMRERVLNEATVKFNGQQMTLQQFLDTCCSEIREKWAFERVPNRA